MIKPMIARRQRLMTARPKAAQMDFESNNVGTARAGKLSAAG